MICMFFLGLYAAVLCICHMVYGDSGTSYIYCTHCGTFQLEEFSLGRRYSGAGCISRVEKVHNDGVSGRGADLNYASERIGQDRRNQKHALLAIDKGLDATWMYIVNV